MRTEGLHDPVVVGVLLLLSTKSGFPPLLVGGGQVILPLLRSFDQIYTTPGYSGRA